MFNTYEMIKERELDAPLQFDPASFRYYPQPFDVTKPPPPPPLVDFTVWPFAGRVVTKESKIETAEYRCRLDEYRRNLRDKHKKKEDEYIRNLRDKHKKEEGE